MYFKSSIVSNYSSVSENETSRDKVSGADPGVNLVESYNSRYSFKLLAHEDDSKV